MKRIPWFVPIFFLPLIAVISGWAPHGYPQLSQCVDPQLQAGLEKELSGLGLAEAVHNKCLSAALVDITDPASPRLATVNGNEMMYAASLPKIAILLGAFERMSRGEMARDQETIQKLTSMIRRSSNQAATDMLNRVGKSFLADLLQSPRYRLYDPARNGGLWVGKNYDASPAWKRDPLHHLSHGATALQTARFYYLLATGRLVSPAFSQEMKTILGDPAIHHKFVQGLENARPGSHVFRKSGTWQDYHADSALVERDGRRYIAVGLAKSPQGGKWLSRLIVAMDDLIFHPGSAAPRFARFHDAIQ
jgi:beta-lactamase class A